MLPTYALDPRELARKIWSPDLLPEKRLWDRLVDSVIMLFRRFTQPSIDIPRAERRGYQRLCNNPRVNAAQLAQKDYEATVDAMRTSERVVLAHDSSEVSKRGHDEPDDAGPLRSIEARGYLMHGCTAVDAATGARLGLFEVTAWTRSWRLKKGDARQRAPHDKESIKWRRGIRSAVKRAKAEGLGATLVHAMDREGDVHENFTFARRHRHLVLTRASADRRVAGKHGMLWAHMEAQPVADTDTIEVPAKITVAARKEARGKDALRSLERKVAALGSMRVATMELRYGQVTFDPPARRKRKPVTVNVVWVREVGAPAWCEPLEWMLLTTCEVKDVRAAWALVREYSLRWGAEDLHKVLKHGLGLEHDRVDSIESFRRQLAIVVPLATHVVQWTYAARQKPGEPAAKYLTPDVLDAIGQAAKYAKLKVSRVPRTLGEIVQRLAQLGGYEPVKGRPPGWQLIWRGWQRLMDFCDVLDFAKSRVRAAPD